MGILLRPSRRAASSLFKTAPQIFQPDPSGSQPELCQDATETNDEDEKSLAAIVGVGLSNDDVGGVVSDTDIWNLVNDIRSLAPKK